MAHRIGEGPEYPSGRGQAAPATMPSRNMVDAENGEKLIEFRVPEDSVAADLFMWWMHTAFEDFVKTVPKMLEYGGSSNKKGSADLRIVGEGLMELLGWDVNSATSGVAQELGCWFYDLGKGGRLVSDYQQRRHGKEDHWFDKSVYAMMARRIQEVGSWP